MSTATESMSAYFRAYYEKHPDQFRKRSNKAVIAQWMTDHPGDKKFPDNARVALQNVKGALRLKGKKKRGRPRKEEAAKSTAVAVAKPAKVSTKLLQTLEDRLDDCLTLLRIDGQDGLSKVVGHLKAARRAIIFMGGE